MMSFKRITMVCFMVTVLMGGCSYKAEKMKGTVERIENFRSEFVSARHIDVFLPAGYEKGELHAVLYMHDGQMLYDSATTWNHQEWGVDETIDQLIQEGKLERCIVVGIWNSGAGRHADYFPQKPFESLPAAFRDSLINSALRNNDTPLFSSNVMSDNYLKFIVEELKPYIDSCYHTKPDRQHTFIAGSSMGGLISMYALCEYPDVFGGAACLSTHWPGIFHVDNNPVPGAFIEYLKNHLPNPSSHRLYFDYGTETLDALYEPFQNEVDKVMAQKGFTHQNWKTLKFEGEDHSENAWRKRLSIPVLFLLEKK